MPLPSLLFRGPPCPSERMGAARTGAGRTGGGQAQAVAGMADQALETVGTWSSLLDNFKNLSFPSDAPPPHPGESPRSRSSLGLRPVLAARSPALARVRERVPITLCDRLEAFRQARSRRGNRVRAACVFLMNVSANLRIDNGAVHHVRDRIASRESEKI